MHSFWIYNIFFLIGFILTEVKCLTSSENIKNNNVYFKAQKRQIKVYGSDPFNSTVLNAATSSSMCVSSLPNRRKNCSLNIKKLGYDHPLIVDPSDHTKFIYPNEEGIIFLNQSQTVFLSCSGTNNTLKNFTGSRSFSNFICICDTIFKANNMIYDLNEVSCTLPPKYEIIDKGFYGRESEYRKFEIGFYTDDENHFLKIIDVHYDRSTTSTMYSKSIISKFIAGRQKTAKQHRYDQTHCCERQRNRLDMDAIYSPKTQDRSFAAQLYCHDSEFHTRCSYLSESSAVIFNRGQLSPKSSFVYSSAGSSTFVYLNTGPQWRPINEGNWARIEDHVIEMTKELDKNLIVYTGVYDRLRLKDTGDGNREKLMFLYAGINNDRSIAIPLYFWKIIYESESKRGVVFVTVNNPYLDKLEDYHICEKPMFNKDGARMPKMWNPTNIFKGYSYMCEVTDFIRNNAIVISDFSASMVTDLLYLIRQTNN